jgi:hypothetical protein
VQETQDVETRPHPMTGETEHHTTQAPAAKKWWPKYLAWPGLLVFYVPWALTHDAKTSEQFFVGLIVAVIIVVIVYGLVEIPLFVVRKIRRRMRRAAQ